MKELYEVTTEMKYKDGTSITVKHFFLDKEEAKKDLRKQEESYKKRGYTFLPRNPATLDEDPIYCQFKNKEDTLHTVTRGKQFLYDTVEETEKKAYASFDL